jgi:hypothetical protein
LSASRTGPDNFLLAWTGDYDDRDIFIQSFTPVGDTRWTTYGDPFAGQDAHHPLFVASTNSCGILFWQSDYVQFVQGAGIVAQRLDSKMKPMWGDDGVNITSNSVTAYGACGDDAGGAYIFWKNPSTSKSFLQHVDVNGVLLWAQPLYVGWGTDASTPILEPDGSGGVIVCWKNFAPAYLYVQRVTSQGQILWGGPNSWQPLTVRASKYIDDGFFGMVGDRLGGGAYVCWTERSAPNASDHRIRASWIHNGGIAFQGSTGAEFTALPGLMLFDDMSRGTEEFGFFLLYDEINGAATRLVLQNVKPGIDGVSTGWMWPANGRTVAENGARFMGDSRLVSDDAGSLVFWTEEPGDLFAQRVDTLAACPWVTKKYRVAQGATGARISAVSDGRHGAFLAWHNRTDNLMYATRLNDSLTVKGNVTISSFVKRKANGVTEPVSSARLVGCPKGDMDDLVFRIEMGGQVMRPFSANELSLSWPTGSGARSFHSAIADSAMRLDGDHYRTTITLRELGGCGVDSCAVTADGFPIGNAVFDLITPDMDVAGTPGNVALPDLGMFATHYPTLYHPEFPYSSCADFISANGGFASTRPDNVIGLADFSFMQIHYGHKKPAQALVDESETASSGEVVLNFTELHEAGTRLLRVGVSLSNMEPFSAAYIALRNDNPLFEFDEWHQSSSYPYTTIGSPAERDGQKIVGIGAFAGKNATAWNGELGTIDMRVSSSAPLELTENDFALVTGDILGAMGQVLSVARRDRASSPKFGNSLSQNYPNPFNPTTTINYSIANAGHVDLTIYDVNGAVVRRLVSGERRPNNYHVIWDGTNQKGNGVASGVYFYKLRAPKFTASKKMVFLK